MQEAADDRCLQWGETRQCIFDGIDNMPGMSNNNPGMSNSQFAQDRGDIIRNCTNSYVECAKDRLEEDLAQLPSCARETLQALAQCAQDNAQTCAESCRAERNATGLALPDNYNPRNLRRCGPLRAQLFRPMCRRAACCPECEEAFEAVNACILEEVAQVTNSTCSMDCAIDINASEDEDSDNEERFRHLRPAVNPSSMDTVLNYKTKEELEPTSRHLQEVVQVSIEDSTYEECIELAPGINPSTRGDPEELANQLEFFECVLDSYVEIVTDEGNGTDDPNDTSNAGRGTLLVSVASVTSWVVLIVFMAI
jgi:hypothetical protein